MLKAPINHKKIDILDGYVFVPEDWIVIKNLNPVECTHVGVVDINRTTEYHAPHFVFFSHEPIPDFRFMRTEERNKLMDACSLFYPPLKEILELQPMIPDEKIQSEYMTYSTLPVIAIMEVPKITPSTCRG